MTNLTEHKCKNKCPEFKGEQCNHCLVQPVETRKIEDMGDDRHIENHVSKNCRVSSRDVLVHLNRAHQAMGEVS
ncbi:hypothetical protein [Acinetobacter nosocomialis]|uniref:hypothetical protein n=1 Tax=Acinetobacter nosocomialis TaxID=106654 RepID=UPI000E2D8764|nr:hypothetical protein [Acinetobacter nosocomialis]AZC10106.1 hypothetical protein DKE47_013825 [Acinetobacter nosocomialis]ELA7628144.1 hypothetical protein [Acinetobacter baumannii]MBR7735650.1 hypothetical protein [Acinetobacter nosocomialis]HBM1866156.1 hypothetical protein [Acinetobacter nosocomialis]